MKQKGTEMTFTPEQEAALREAIVVALTTYYPAVASLSAEQANEVRTMDERHASETADLSTRHASQTTNHATTVATDVYATVAQTLSTV